MDVSAYLLIFMGILICYLYVVMSEYFTHRKCNYIHSTAVAILVGMLAGTVLTLSTDIFNNNQYGTSLRNVIILVLLPPMLFQDGYNIRKRKFFQNIFYINLYGIGGTFLYFLIVFFCIYGFNYYGFIRSFNNQVIQLKIWQILAMSSCLCSIDTVVPEQIVNPERYPKLFSIIFGESIMKDTIAVTMFDSVLKVYHKLQQTQTKHFDAAAIGFLVLKFLEVVIGSILIGIIGAIITTLMFKNMRFLMAQKGVAEVALILMTGYGTYILSEWASFSGVISMLFCGITLSHFNVYNLTEQGKSAAKITVSTIALVVQGLLFFLLGAFIFSIQFNSEADKTSKYTFSYTLLFIAIGALIIARIVNIYFMSFLGYLFLGAKKWRINVYEYQILTVSGFVKGAIPFALILTMPTKSQLFSTTCIQNATISIVLLSSLFMNSIMPKILRNRLSKIDQMIRFHADDPSLNDSLLLEYKNRTFAIENQNENKKQNNSEIQDKFISKISKAQLQKLALYARLKSSTQKYWRRCEQGFLKPHLIYDYYNRKQQIKQQKIRTRKKQAQQFWKRFTDDFQFHHNEQETEYLLDAKLIQNDIYSEEQQEKDAQLEQLIDKQKRHNSLTSIQLQQQIIQPSNKSKSQGIRSFPSSKKGEGI